MTEEKKSDIVKDLKKKLFDKYDLNLIEDDVLEDIIRHLLIEEIRDEYVTIEERIDITERVYDSIRGFGILDSIMKDEKITEIMINGPNEIFVEKKGSTYKLDQTFDDERQLEDIIQKIVGQAGREVNQANPIVDTRLPNGSRVNVVLPPI